tara:strand:+ start:89 stop:646 length:558 start_codon:yes stop_codon:yes gene_type:complete
MLSAFNCLLSVATTKPNFLVLFLDDHGWGDVGANWNETTETPRMDQLAAEGVRFTDFHASYSVCTASRGALLTGRLAPRTGVASNFGPYSTHGMALQERTIANELNDLGYESHMIGKVSYLADTESAILSLTLPILPPPLLLGFFARLFVLPHCSGILGTIRRTTQPTAASRPGSAFPTQATWDA